MAHSGQGTLACVECTSSVICADVVSTSQAARRSRVASGHKQARTSGVWVATKARSSSKRRCLWGHADGVAHRHQVCHKQVYGRMRYNSEESSDIPQRYITKSGQEPINCVNQHGLWWTHFYQANGT